MINIGVVGAAGRMGRMIINAISINQNTVLSAALEQAKSAYIGKNIGDLIGNPDLNVALTCDVDEFIDNSDVIIDFSTISATLNLIKKIKDKSKKLVIGTTGFDVKEKKIIDTFSKTNAVVFSPNMSVGVNLLFKIVEETAKILSGYDIEIIESHHNKKKDSPSGTAMRLAEIAAAAVNRDLKKCGVYGRKGLIGERKKQEIGILAVRAGDIVGEHTVMFVGQGERIELIHRAQSRETFANGAVHASVWIANKKNGLFTMADVLGI